MLATQLYPARIDGPTPIRLPDLVQLTRTVADDVRSGLHNVEFNPTDRWSVRLSSDDYKDVWLISWTHDQSTELHDHAGSLGALTVVAGTLTERYWSANIDGAGQPGLRTHTLPASRSIAFPVGHVHDVLNTFAEPAISVHAYSPPITAMGYYDVDGAGALRRVRTILIDNPEPNAPILNAIPVAQ
jgi:predicted metal-dependent enzyme (double-stranded beta helix superfamily)